MEFQESDIIFSNEYFSNNSMSISNLPRSSLVVKKEVQQQNQQRSSSVPLSIPGSSSSSPSSSFRYDVDCFGDDDFVDDNNNNNNEIVPPHVILDRRCGNFNVNAKKRKNLIHFRNSILKLTGFLES